jgi:hypothetical protein
MARLQYFEEWKWLEEPWDERWQRLFDAYRPFDAVAEHGPICSECGREVEILFFDPRINSEAGMREAAQRMIKEARQAVERDRQNCCGNHNLRWAAMA